MAEEEEVGGGQVRVDTKNGVRGIQGEEFSANRGKVGGGRGSIIGSERRTGLSLSDVVKSLVQGGNWERPWEELAQRGVRV